MGTKSSETSLELDSTTRIICPYCGSRIRVNDLLFRSGMRLSISEDNRLSDYYLRFKGRLPDERDYRNGWTRPAKLVSWTGLPNRQIGVHNGFVLSVADYDGETMSEKACLWCHNIISDDLITKAGNEIALFAQPEAAKHAAWFVRQFTSRSHMNNESLKDLGYFVFRDWIVYDCTETSALDNERRQRAMKTGSACKKAVFFIKTHADTAEGESGDLGTIIWLQTALSGIYGISTINLPTALIMIPDAEEQFDDIEEAHSVLCMHLDGRFKINKRYIWRSPEQTANEFENITAWLKSNDG